MQGEQVPDHVSATDAFLHVTTHERLASELGHSSQRQEIFQHKLIDEATGEDTVNRAFAPAAASGS